MPTTLVSKSIPILFLLLLSAEIALAQASDTHQVTIHVNPMMYLTLNNAALSINVTGAGAVAGQETFQATNQTTLLNWASNYNTGKITVNTSLAAGLQRFDLTVQAVNITGPCATHPIVTLDGTAHDFMTGTMLNLGSCNLLYTCTAYASRGTGYTDVHTITYTISQ